MPYVTRKKTKQIHKGPTMLLKVDLADDKFPKHYRLDYGIPTIIRGTVTLLVDENNYVKFFINKDYEFQVRNRQPSYGVYERYLMLPKELVNDFAIDEGMGIELVLNEVDLGGEAEKIFSERIEQGSMDFEPKAVSGEMLSSSEMLINTNFTEKHYVDLVSEINNAFRIRLFTATLVLIRKLFESLIIDLLRQRYGMQSLTDIELYYCLNHHRFHNFSTLIDNLGKKLDDFGPYTDALKQDKEKERFMEFLKNITEEGNANAHSMEILHDPQKRAAWKPSINEYSALMVRVTQLIDKYSQKMKT